MLTTVRIVSKSITLLFMWFLVSCSNEAISADETENLIIFKGVGGAEVVEFLFRGQPPKAQFVSYDDIIGPIEYCDDPEYLLCVESPFSLYVPKDMNAKPRFESAYASGTTRVLSYDTIDSNELCDHLFFWVISNDERGKEYGWYFSSDDGLIGFYERRTDGKSDLQPFAHYIISDNSRTGIFNICDIK